MAKSKTDLIEVCIDEYEKQIPVPGGKKDEHGSLSDEQKTLLESCVNGSVEPEAAAAKLPRFAPWPLNSSVSRGKLEDWVDDNSGKKEIPKILRFLALAQAAGGSEFVSGEIHEFMEWDYKGYKRSNFFGDGCLSPLVELNFLFYELYDDIHEYDMNKPRTEIDGVYAKNPALFKEIAVMEGHPIASLRAASYLHRKGDTSMEKRIGDLLSSFKEIDDEFSFTLCAENGFTHPVLREKLKERFIKFPSHLTDRISWNLYHCDKFLDRSLIVKKRNDEKEEPAKMAYVLAMCRDLGIPDKIAIQGIIGEFSNYHKQELAAFLKPFSSKEFEENISYLYQQGGDYGIVSAMLALITVCDSRPKEDWKLLVNILADRFDDLLKQQVISCAEDGGDKKLLEQYFFKNDDDALNRITREIRSASTEAELFGYFAEEEPLKEKLRRYAVFLTLPSQLYSACPFTRSLWRKYRWDADTFTNYFLDSSVDIQHKLAFIDEMTIPDSVRRPKE